MSWSPLQATCHPASSSCTISHFCFLPPPYRLWGLAFPGSCKPLPVAFPLYLQPQGPVDHMNIQLQGHGPPSLGLVSENLVAPLGEARGQVPTCEWTLGSSEQGVGAGLEGSRKGVERCIKVGERDGKAEEPASTLSGLWQHERRWLEV